MSMRKWTHRLATLLRLLILTPGIALADLSAHFLDVGQGDAVLVICDGEAMLIDGGQAQRPSSSIPGSGRKRTCFP